MSEAAEATWTDVCAAADVQAGRAKLVIIAARAYAVCNDDGRFVVVDNACPHAGGNLGRGTVNAGRVSCPWHYYEWDLTTGVSTTPCAQRLRIYKTRVEQGRVLAQLPG